MQERRWQATRCRRPTAAVPLVSSVAAARCSAAYSPVAPPRSLSFLSCADSVAAAARRSPARSPGRRTPPLPPVATPPPPLALPSPPVAPPPQRALGELLGELSRPPALAQIFFCNNISFIICVLFSNMYNIFLYNNIFFCNNISCIICVIFFKYV
jgi:hypothetical protein